jgi:DNA processing protein
MCLPGQAADRRLWLRLHVARGVGGAKVARLLAEYGHVEAVFAAGREDLEPRPGLAGVFDALHEPGLEEQVDSLLEKVSRLPDVHILTPDDGHYPPRLLNSPAIPPVLFVRGRLDHALPSAAVVGSRKASGDRLRLTCEWCQVWAEHGVSIVSGLAQGIDAAAHRGALEASGHTVAVLGTGLDRTYPSTHVALQDRILDAGGAVVSQFTPGAPTHPGYFPARNGTMAGLADAVVIMQASRDSGALYTAAAGARAGRPLLVAPSHPADRDNEGGLGLLRRRACAIGSPEDLFRLLHLKHRDPGLPPAPPRPPEEQRVLEALDFRGRSLDELTRALALPAATVLDRLLRLELAGVVVRQPGPRYVRTR